MTRSATCHEAPLYALGLCQPCYQRESRRQKIALRNAGRVCENCLEKMPDAARGNRRYCSMKCKYQARNIRTYGLTSSDFRELTASGRCPICLNKVKRWQIDHRHSDNLTFGAVCYSCNAFLLAGSRHDVDIARRLVEYLEHPPATQVGTLGPKHVELTQRNISKRRRDKGRRIYYGDAPTKTTDEEEPNAAA